MADVAELVIRMTTETDKASKDVDAAAGRLEKIQGTARKLAAPMALAATAVIAFGKVAADSASRTQQAMGAVDSVFGKSAGKIKSWAAEAATSVGLAKSEYGELASVIGSQLKNMGLPMDQVVGKTNDLIKLGADLAATYGGTTADAVEALSSTLRGETDPIERYGVSINQAAIAAKQAQDGTSHLTGAAGKQAKTMATLALISQQTADAQGQFAEESDSAAGSAQIASAQYENMKSALGTALLPVISLVAGMLGKLAQVVGDHPKIAQAAAVAILAMAAAVFVLSGITKVLIAVETIQAAVASAAWLATLWPILLVIAAVAAVVVIIVILWKKSQTFRTIVTGAWNAIRAAAIATGNAIRVAWNAVAATLAAVASRIRAMFSATWSAIRAGASAAVGGVRAVWSSVSGFVSGVLARIRSAAASAWAAIRAGAAALHLTGPFEAVLSVIHSIIGAVQSLIGALGRIKVPKISLPHIPGTRAVPPPATVGALAAPGVGGLAAPATTAASSGALVININGALDPEAVARQVRRLLSAHGQRIGSRGTTGPQVF